MDSLLREALLTQAPVGISVLDIVTTIWMLNLFNNDSTEAMSDEDNWPQRTFLADF